VISSQGSSCIGFPPSGAIAHHSVEDGEELSGERDEGHLGRLSMVAEALVERAEDGIEARTRHGGEIEGGPHGGAPATDSSLTSVLAAVSSKGSDSDEGADLSAAQRAEFGEIDEQRPCDSGPHGGCRLEQLADLAAFRVLSESGIDRRSSWSMRCCRIAMSPAISRRSAFGAMDRRFFSAAIIAISCLRRATRSAAQAQRWRSALFGAAERRSVGQRRER